MHRTRRSRAITSRRDFRLHFTDWGNPSAPPLLLVHGGLDHSRSWDHLARALRRDFHVVAPDLRGHGDFDWATGSSYSLADHVYDLTGLVKSAGFDKVAIVGHSMGGMVSLTYAGAFPEKVSQLVVLDGVTNFPARRSSRPTSGSPTGSAISTSWRSGKSTAIRPSPMAPSGSVGRNPRLTREQAMHLATHGLKRNDDGSLQLEVRSVPARRARPIGCRSKTMSRLWSRIACPTLLVSGSESFLPDPEKAGVIDAFQARPNWQRSPARVTGCNTTSRMKCWG